ncbi:MAG: hypothetical protein JSU01_07715 [Bacteroidetes bacterium]|nr:hypothetical protein [Bacteroidota bacterium]
MKSIFSKAAATAVIASIFAINVQAGTVRMAADTGKMDKMSKMGKMNKMDHKMDKKKMNKMKKGKMGKDTTKM